MVPGGGWSLGWLIGRDMRHKYCLYSFPMKVETQKAFKRSQGLPRDVCNSIYLVFASVTRPCMVSAEIHAQQPNQWNLTQDLESVCFKSQTGLQNPKSFKKTRNHMRRQSGRTLKHGSARNKIGALCWVYPHRGSRRARQGKVPEKTSQFN